LLRPAAPRRASACWEQNRRARPYLENLTTLCSVMRCRLDTPNADMPRSATNRFRLAALFAVLLPANASKFFRNRPTQPSKLRQRFVATLPTLNL